MSRRRLVLDPPEDELDEDEDEELPDPLEDVEYFVEVEDELSWVLTSVPKSVHSSQTSSSAPSILTRLGEATSFPHISH
jgi:hypothetical protein